jgi:hypothetical protein
MCVGRTPPKGGANTHILRKIIKNRGLTPVQGGRGANKKRILGLIFCRIGDL